MLLGGFCYQQPNTPHTPNQPTKYVNRLLLLVAELGPGRLTQVEPVGARQADQLA